MPKQGSMPEVGERWQFKSSRGSGTFTVVRVKGDRVTLLGYFGKRKTISLRTLRGDYERAERI